MKIIYKIAKKELQVLFYSPIAWLLLLCFIAQTAFFFTDVYLRLVMNMESNGVSFRASIGPFVEGTLGLGLWYRMQSLLYLYIPLLTMGVVSREFSSGSIKMLYAAPITNMQIILGKFFAMVGYALLLMAILLIYVIFAWCTIENFEATWILTGLLGLFLLTCTYMAVGIFVSSLTSYQIIAAVGTFVVLMLLSMIGGWWQHYDFIREITYWLGINGRASTFINGMLCSEDLIYFPVVTMLFLALTIIRLQAVRQKQRFVKTLGKNSVVILSVCVIAYLSSQPMLTGYYDATSTKKNTLTPVSQNIIEKVEGGMTITSYVNVLDPFYSRFFGYPHFIMRNREQFRQYTRFKPEIKLKVVYYYAKTPTTSLGGKYEDMSAWEQARKVCEMYDADSTMLKSREEVDKMVDLSEEGYTFIRQIVRDNGQKEWLRMYPMGPQPLPSEAEISVAFKRMVITLPKLGFVTGHRERDVNSETPQGYNFLWGNKKVQVSAWNQGFDVTEITLTERVSQDINVVILANQRSELTPEEEISLQEYIDRGGSLFILGEPRYREIQNPLLRKLFGVELTPLVVGNDVRYKGKLLSNVLACRPSAEGKKEMYPIAKTSSVAMQTCAGIEQVEEKGFSLQSFVKCDTMGVFWTELETTDFVDDTVRFNPAIGEVSKVFTTVAGLTRKVGGKEQRILLSGDSDCLSNNEFLMTRGVSALNNHFQMGTCEWLSHGQVPVDVRRPMPTDNKVFLSMSGYKLMKWAFLGFLPLSVLGAGVYVWLRRRGR